MKLASITRTCPFCGAKAIIIDDTPDALISFLRRVKEVPLWYGKCAACQGQWIEV